MLLLAFCEAFADFTITSELIDRVLRAHGPPWVADAIDDNADLIRTWHGPGDPHRFFDLHAYRDIARSLSVRVPHGRFDGARSYGELMALTVFAIARRLKLRGTPIDAVVLLWDMDDQPAPRAMALARARDEARSWVPFEIVIGRPNAKREAWVLAGFDPFDDDERERLQHLRRELGFLPNEQSSLLDAKAEGAKLNAKRVLALLSGDDRERERRCWIETDLEVLERRGKDNGLREFLAEVKDRIVPLCQSHR